jgi:predicted metalloendopeptidase
LHRTDPSNVAAEKILLHRISTCSTLDAIGTAIGELNRYQIRAPLTFVVTRDAYDSSTCRIHFYEPSLGLPSYAPYRTQSNPTLTAYGALLKKVGDLLGFSDLDEVIQIEQLVYKYLSSDGTLDDPTESHFLHTLDSFTKIYPNIPITTMLEGWGCSKATIHSTTFVITAVSPWAPIQ